MNCVSCDVCVYHLGLCVFSPGYSSAPEWLEPVLWPRTWLCELMWGQQQQQWWHSSSFFSLPCLVFSCFSCLRFLFFSFFVFLSSCLIFSPFFPSPCFFFSTLLASCRAGYYLQCVRGTCSLSWTASGIIDGFSGASSGRYMHQYGLSTS